MCSLYWLVFHYPQRSEPVFLSGNLFKMTELWICVDTKKANNYLASSFHPYCNAAECFPYGVDALTQCYF